MKIVFIHLTLLLAVSAFAQQPASPAPDSIAQRLLKSIDARPNQPDAGTSNPRLGLDLYLPKNRATEKPLPVIGFIHGGAWRGGDRKRAGGVVLPLAASGEYAGVSVGYRVSEEAKWPAQIHDCKAAIRWLRRHAKELNLDPERIGVWGPSAGGHLVSLLGTSVGVAELDGALGEFVNLNTRVTCVVNHGGPADMTVPVRPTADPDSVDDAVAGLLGGAPKETEAKAASPLTHITRDDAPFFTSHSTEDERVDFQQSVKLDAALKRAGVSSLLIPVSGSGHGIPMTAELRGRIVQFFSLHLRGVRSEILNALNPFQSRGTSPAN